MASVVQVEVMLYRWGGESFGLKIRTPCKVCDRSLDVIRGLLEGEFRHLPVVLEVRNWLDHLFACLRHGGRHTPVIFVDGKFFTQGVIPDREKSAERLRQRLDKHFPVCPACGKFLIQDYAEHRRSESRIRVLRYIAEQHPEWVGPGGLCGKCLLPYEKKIESDELIL